MFARLAFAAVFATLIAASAGAQVVRFETTVGDFDMVLNPTNDPRLQTHVDNMLAYVEDNRYRASWINRAPEGFVLQMGSFFSHTKRPPLTLDSTRPVIAFDPIPGQPASNLGLSNTVGTVALAIPGSNRDGGSSSFFINLGNNSMSLDGDFTVFAVIDDMAPINQIMSLPQVDLRDALSAGASNVHFQDIPLADGKQVFIRRTFEVTDSLSIARARGRVQPFVAASLAAAGSGEPPPAVLTSAIVPEPATWMMLVVSWIISAGLLRLGRRTSTH